MKADTKEVNSIMITDTIMLSYDNKHYDSK